VASILARDLVCNTNLVMPELFSEAPNTLNSIHPVEMFSSERLTKPTPQQEEPSRRNHLPPPPVPDWVLSHGKPP
jgi:hypothetical protein